MVEFNKPSDDEVEEIAGTFPQGITAYAIAKVVNGWLAEEGIETEVTSQRVYGFAGRVDDDQRLGKRFTDEGAQDLARFVYAWVKSAASDS